MKSFTKNFRVNLFKTKTSDLDSIMSKLRYQNAIEFEGYQKTWTGRIKNYSFGVGRKTLQSKANL